MRTTCLAMDLFYCSIAERPIQVDRNVTRRTRRNNCIKSVVDNKLVKPYCMLQTNLQLGKAKHYCLGPNPDELGMNCQVALQTCSNSMSCIVLQICGMTAVQSQIGLRIFVFSWQLLQPLVATVAHPSVVGLHNHSTSFCRKCIPVKYSSPTKSNCGGDTAWKPINLQILRDATCDMQWTVMS